MPEKNRNALDAATEITIAAISAGKLVPSIANPDFQKNVTEFFSAVYKQVELDVGYKT